MVFCNGRLSRLRHYSEFKDQTVGLGENLEMGFFVFLFFTSKGQKCRMEAVFLTKILKEKDSLNIWEQNWSNRTIIEVEEIFMGKASLRKPILLWTSGDIQVSTFIFVPIPS